MIFGLYEHLQKIKNVIFIPSTLLTPLLPLEEGKRVKRTKKRIVKNHPENVHENLFLKQGHFSMKNIFVQAILISSSLKDQSIRLPQSAPSLKNGTIH